MPTYPNVPNVPGVPALPRNPTAAALAIELLLRDALDALGINFAPQWGIFLDGEVVIAADSVQAFDYRQSWNIADYPLEAGAFESYDKVQVPFETRVRMASGGSEAERQTFLSSIAAIAGDLELYDVVTPDAIYLSVNIHHYDYSRKSFAGVGMITADVWLKQVRVSATAEFTSTKTPSGSASVNGGTVQTLPATPQQQNQAVDVQ